MQGAQFSYFLFFLYFLYFLYFVLYFEEWSYISYIIRKLSYIFPIFCLKLWSRHCKTSVFLTFGERNVKTRYTCSLVLVIALVTMVFPRIFKKTSKNFTNSYWYYDFPYEYIERVVLFLKPYSVDSSGNKSSFPKQPNLR